MERIRSFISAHRTEVLIFTGALTIRALYVFAVQLLSGTHGFISHADAEFFYYRSAVNLVEHGVFSVAPSAPYFPDGYHTPLYSLLVAPFIFLRIPLLGIVLLQSIIAAATVVLVYITSLEITKSNKLSIAVAGIAALEPMSIYWNGLIMSDTIFAFLMSCAVLLLIRQRFFASSFALGLAALTRPIALYFAPFFFCMMVYQMYRSHSTGRHIARDLSLGIVIFSLTIVPWFVRNKIVFNEFAFTSAGWYELYVAPMAEFAQARQLQVPEIGSELTPEQSLLRFDFKYSPQYKAAFMSVVAHDPFGYFVTHVERSIYSFFSNRYDYLVHVVLQSQAPSLYTSLTFMLPIVLFLGSAFWIAIYFLGLCAYGDASLRPWWFFFWSLIGVNALLSGGINPGGSDMSRYSLGFYAFIFMLAGVGLMQIAKWRVWGRG